MKQCTRCSTKNPDSAKFCQGCGLTLEGVESVRTDFPGTAGNLFAKAGSALSDGTKKAKDAAAAGVGKARGAATAGKEEIPNPVQAGGWDRPASSSDNSRPNGGWDNMTDPNKASSVAVKKYSFFQSEEEETLAVIGERAAVSDLEGTYRGPYAVLTKERLYCKNEEGNFIIPASEILSASETPIKKFEWAFWATVVTVMIFGVYALPVILTNSAYEIDPELRIRGYGIMIAMIATGVSIYFHRCRDLKKTSIALAFNIFSPGLNIIFAAVYLYQAWKNRAVPRTFSIHCVGRAFPFALENYPELELQDFQKQVSLLTGVPFESTPKAGQGNGAAKARGNPYQASRRSVERKGSPIVTAAAVLVILAIVIFAGVSIFNALTTCKVDGCGNEVYKNGYCTRHYAGNRANQAAGDLFDSLFG